MLVVLAESFSPWHALDIKPVLLACFQHLGDYERVGFCCAGSVQTFQPSGSTVTQTKGMSLKLA